MILMSFVGTLLICHKSLKDQRANTAAIPTPNPSLEPLHQISCSRSQATLNPADQGGVSSNILHVKPLRNTSSEESILSVKSMSLSSRKSIIRTGRRPRTKTPPPKKSYSDDSTLVLPVVVHESTEQESSILKQYPRKTDSEESKLGIPMVTLTPSPSVHFSQHSSIHCSESPSSAGGRRSSSPTQSSFSHLSHGNFSLAPSFTSAGTIPSISSVSLNFLLSVDENEPQLAQDKVCFSIAFIFALASYFVPLIVFLEDCISNVYLFSIYCVLSIASSSFYFALKPDHLTKVFNEVLTF